jgi:hypothetical protein
LGPRVLEKLKVPSNIHLAVSKSGKLDKSIMKTWVTECLDKVTDQKMVLLLDSWSGQQDQALYESVPRCKRLQIPPKTTASVQPLDRYFFRQYKIVRRAIHERILIDDLDIDLKSRDNVLKMHSLIFDKFQSDSFRPMLRYSWFACGYTDERAGRFENARELLFCQIDEECHEDMCDQSTFIRCSHCKKHLCFEHFYIHYHFHNELNQS